LDHGADPDSPVAIKVTRITAIFFTIRNRDNLDFTRLLIGYGANVNHQSRYGNTPILAAVTNSNYPQALLLLEAGADPELGGDLSSLPRLESWPEPEPREDSLVMSALISVRMNHEMKLGHLERGAYQMEGYMEFIDALKARGYLEEDF
jgi:ankyrin repeat protein